MGIVHPLRRSFASFLPNLVNITRGQNLYLHLTSNSLLSLLYHPASPPTEEPRIAQDEGDLGELCPLSLSTVTVRSTKTVLHSIILTGLLNYNS